MKQSLHLIILLYVLLVVLACGERREYREALSRAEAAMSEHPDSALLILDSLGQHEQEFGKHFRMQYLLHRLNAENKTSAKFTSDSLAKVLADHFDSHGTTNERVLAHYLLGRAFSDMEEAPDALQTYYDALTIADTTKADCDFRTLKGIYGQMSRIFHQQNLPHDEIWALQHYIDCIRRTSSEEEYLVAKGQLIRPYYLLGEKDTVLHIIYETYHSLKQLGKDQRAASILPTAIYIYVERHELSKAKEIIDIFENESGQFDERKNIAKGREHYYYTKGFYELAINEKKKAEIYFRKAVRYGYLSEGYKGLLSIYRKENNIDSIVHFSHLYEAAQDILHNKMQTDAIHQMSALYNYTRSQKEAEQEREKAREAFILLGYIIFIAIVLLFIILAISWMYRKNQKEKQKKIAKLEESLNSAKLQRSAVQEELRKLKGKDYEGMIAEKEKQEAELTLAIERLQAENDRYKNNIVKRADLLDDFLNSNIAHLFIKKANGKAERPIPSEAEWRLLMSQFSKDNPVTFKSFSKGKSLSPLEQRICVLLILGIPEKIISMMTDSVASTISNAKARANQKLYGKKDAHSLKTNLIHALRQS